MKRIIKIFLASSIVELTNERMAIENFIRNVSDKFEEHYDVKIQPWLCENFDDAYTKVRKQEEYNEKIRESELCFFIFFTKAGEYTREEFEVASKRFEETGKPKIYTYFKIVEEGQAEQSLYDFMKELDSVFGHYYGTFDHIDTVKLRILLSLKLQEMDFLEIKTDGGKCVVDGKAVMSLDNVSEFANNKNLAALQEELRKTEEEYYELKPIYAKGGCDDAFYSRYSRVASKRQSLIDEIEELQGLIFNISLRMVSDDIHGEISRRQKEAYRLFEVGDYEGCMAVLDSGEMDDEFLREEKRDAERRVARRRKYIREYKTKIDILQVMRDYAGRFDEITECYEKIVPYALTERIELGTVYWYASFLYDQNKHKKAIEIAEKLSGVYDTLDDVSIEDKSMLLNLLGILYSDQGQAEKAKKFLLKAIAIYEVLAKDNPDRFNPDLARSYYNAGTLYSSESIAASYNGAGDYFYTQDLAKIAEDFLLKAISIFEALSQDNPDRFNSSLAASYNGAGDFYYTHDQTKKAEGYFLKAINIYEALAKDNPDRFNPDLAVSYKNVSDFYYTHDQTKKAEEFLLKAISIREVLAKDDPDRFSSDLATIYYSIGKFYCKHDHPEKTEDYYLKAIAIYEALAEDNPGRFNSDLAQSYNNAGAFYKDQDQSEKTEIYYLKAIAIYEALVKDNPNWFNPYLAVSYYNFATFKGDDSYFQKALEIALTKPNHPRCKKIIRALQD